MSVTSNDLDPSQQSHYTMLHSVHHWAQVAMEVRQAGFPTEKPQDIIISPVMD